MDYFEELIGIIKKEKPNKAELSKLKLKLCSKHKRKHVPTDIEILLHAKSKDFPKLKELQTKPVRTKSGVTIIAIMSKPFKCPHGKCAMCPGGPNSFFGDIPQSYTGEAPATMRAKRNFWDPYLQVFNRLEQYVVLGHNFEKIDLIVMGGTFISFPKKYKEDFIMYSFKAMNDFSKMFFRKDKFLLNKFREFFELPADVNNKERYARIVKKMKKLKTKNKRTLGYEKKYNDFSSKIKCIGLTIETRPDYSMLKHANEMLKFGCTRVELGVQSTNNKVLSFIERGHSVEDSIKATKILKDLAFKINYHMMPGAYTNNIKENIDDLKNIIIKQEFRPDMLKIYPCMVLKGTKIYNLWKKQKFKPSTTEQAANIIAEFKRIVPKYIRIMRVQRDIPTKLTEAGVSHTNLRQFVHKKMEEKGIICNCIRCREPGKKITGKIKMNIIEYSASEGKEFFISFDAGKKILGFCRLRFPHQSLRKEITEKSALIRELHVYGHATGIGKQGNIQHKGLGKKLLKKAEEIARKNKKEKMVIISGVGVRGYYRKYNYRKQGPYMVKQL